MREAGFVLVNGPYLESVRHTVLSGQDCLQIVRRTGNRNHQCLDRHAAAHELLNISLSLSLSLFLILVVLTIELKIFRPISGNPSPSFLYFAKTHIKHEGRIFFYSKNSRFILIFFNLKMLNKFFFNNSINLL